MSVDSRRGRCPRFVAVALAIVTLGSCGGSKSPSSPSPPGSDFAAQFDSLWNTFDQQYSYFDYKHIDWNALKDRFRPMAIAAGDQASFIGVVRQMLSALHDQHVVIRDPGGAVTPTYDPGYFINWDRTVWQQYLARGTWTSGRGDWGHGTLNGMAYIQIGGWNTASFSVNEFDTAFENFRNAPVLILDVRMNGGGDSQLAFQVAGRFATSSVTTGYSKFRMGPLHSDFGPLMAITLSPRGSWQYTRPVLLLIGRRCLSSNEAFISAMRQLRNVTLVGDQTGGGSGNPGTFPLAGGWSYTVSRWIEYTADQQVIEDVGIAPQISVAATSADFAQGKDPVLDFALSSAAAAGRSMVR
jgi:Peptidase family S41/Tricorn protease C1 domain